MTNITVNEAKRTIEVSKKFQKAASRYGSEEYKTLQEVRRDYPTFKVVVKTTKRKETYSGLTYSYMESYILKHDDEKKSIMETFNILRAKGEEAETALAEAASYGEVREWFLEQFTDIADFHKKREAILKNTRDKKEARIKKELASKIEEGKAA